MDLLDRLLDKLEEQSLFSSISVDVLLADDNTIALRQTPSSPLTRFLDNSKDDEFSFQIIVKNADQKTSIDTLQSIKEVLEKLNDLQSLDNSFTFIKCETYVNPTLVEKDSRGSYIYTALFKINYHTQ